MARIVKGKQFVAVDFQGNEYNNFRMKQINGYWFGIIDRHQGEDKYYCTLKQIDSKSLIDVKNIK